MDEVFGLTCQIVPGVRQNHGPGWYLISVGDDWDPTGPVIGHVECGPFASEVTAARAAQWMDEEAMGVYPAPWVPYFSRRGLIVGTRLRPPRRRSQVAC